MAGYLLLLIINYTGQEDWSVLLDNGNSVDKKTITLTMGNSTCKTLDKKINTYLDPEQITASIG